MPFHLKDAAPDHCDPDPTGSLVVLRRIPGVLIAGMYEGRILITLSPDRSRIEDVARFLRRRGVSVSEYECGVVSRRYRETPLPT